MAWNQITRLPRGPAPAKDEQGRSRESKENEIGRDHVIEYLLILPRKRDDDGERALQCDSDHRHLCSRRDISHAAKEKAILGHRKVGARRGEHSLAEESEG